MKRKNTELQIRDTRKTVLTVIKYVVLIIGALVMMFPFIWMLLTSLKTLPEAISIPPQWMPETPQWKNYEYSWNLVPFAMFFRNTIWVGILSVVVTLAFSILGAYAFSIYSFPGRNLCFYLFMLTMMVPSEILIIQNYVTCSRLGLLDSFSGIVLPTVANGFYIFTLLARRSKTARRTQQYFSPVVLPLLNESSMPWQVRQRSKYPSSTASAKTPSRSMFQSSSPSVFACAPP